MAGTCTTDGCDRPTKARGLCGTCYNRTLPNRHRKVIVPCDCCGQPTPKEARARRYAGTYCSLVCRDYSRWGAASCELPSNHWARCFGATSLWTPPEPKHSAFQVGSCDECGANIVEPTGQTPSVYCGMTCTRRVRKRRRRAREHNAPGLFTYTQVMRQYRRQGNTCAYCKTPSHGLPDPEHVLPLSRGGRNDMSNIVAACRACNSDKGDMTLAEWARDRDRRGLKPIDTTLDGAAYLHLWQTEPSGTSKRLAAA
jgi:5-methylcytosine-specific restriction endonuclease McrA